MEIGMMVLFVIYLVADIYPPEIMASYIDTPIGMVGVLLTTLYVFMNFKPILGVIFLFVAYEIVRRSARVNNRVPMMLYTPSQAKKDTELAEMNPVQPTTLEEEVVEQMAPVGKSSLISYTMSEYKPISSDIHNASSI
jgi:hypothetical protein